MLTKPYRPRPLDARLLAYARFFPPGRAVLINLAARVVGCWPNSARYRIEEMRRAGLWPWPSGGRGRPVGAGPVPPCKRCGTRGGRRHKGTVLPSRRDVREFGGPDCACLSCADAYRTAALQGRKVRPARRPFFPHTAPTDTPPPAPATCDLCGELRLHLTPGGPHQLEGDVCNLCVEEIQAEARTKANERQRSARAMARSAVAS
jgi:hypothetical protein